MPTPTKDYNVTLRFYVNSGDEKDIKKPLDEKFVLTRCAWKADTSILKPTFSFHKFKQEGSQVWKNFNYVSMEWAGLPTRYYFVKDLRVCLGGIIEIDCEEDLRHTWRKYIKAQRWLIARNEFVNNKVLNDPRKVLPLTRQIDVYTFEQPVGEGDNGDGTIILTVSGSPSNWRYADE